MAETLDYLGHDPSTRAIGLYLEGNPSARSLMEAAGRTSLRKPVMVLKVGRCRPALLPRGEEERAMAVREETRQTLDQITATCRAEGRRQLTEWETYTILQPFQIPIAPCELVHTPDEAAEAAQRLGGRVAVKVVSPAMGHKTEAGWVRLNVSGPMEAAAAFTEALKDVTSARPDGRGAGPGDAPGAAGLPPADRRPRQAARRGRPG